MFPPPQASASRGPARERGRATDRDLAIAAGMAGSATRHQHGTVRRPGTLQVEHPGSRRLNDTELALLEPFRSRLHERLRSVGLTVDDMRQLLRAMHRHPEASAKVIRSMREEASALMPGQSLFGVDWDGGFRCETLRDLGTEAVALRQGPGRWPHGASQIPSASRSSDPAGSTGAMPASDETDPALNQPGRAS